MIKSEQEAVIAEIIEAAVRWISTDADHPDTPPERWQEIIPLMKAAPEMNESMGIMARLKQDGEDDFDLTNDDAVDSLHECIDLARDALEKASAE